jgi:hypothetical protein
VGSEVEDLMQIGDLTRFCSGFATPLLAPLPKEGLSSSAQLHGIIETLLRPYERKRVSISDSDETGNDTGAGPSQRDEENDAQGPSSSQEIAMTEVDEADDDNGLNEATSGKSGTEHYEDAEDADANGDEDMDEVSTPQVGLEVVYNCSSKFLSLGQSQMEVSQNSSRTARLYA